MKIKHKPYFRKAVYLVGTTVVLTGILIMTAKMFPKVKLTEAKNEKKIISEIKIADMKFSNTTTTSRGSDETRTSEEETKNTQKKDSTKAVTQKSETKNNNKNDTTKSASTTKNKTNTTKKTTTSSNEPVKMTGLKISKDMDLTVRTGLSRDEFIKLMAGLKVDTSGFFEENAGTIYDLCEKYNINEIFFCGLISAESGWNIASNHRRTHNYISLMYKGRLISYGSVYEGLEVAAQKLHKNYLTPGGAFYHGKTLYGVKTCFCPSGTWVDLVYGRMKQIVK